MGSGETAVRSAVCYVVAYCEPGTIASSMRVRMRMTDDLESSSATEIHVLGIDEACSVLRAWMEGLVA